MTRLNIQQHYQLSGGSLDWASYFGGFQSLLGGIFVPVYGSQSEDGHPAEMLNLLASIGGRMVNTCAAEIYKDSDDTDSEFRVSVFTMQFRNHKCTLASTGPYGDLVTGINYVWADLTAAPTVTIAFGAAWPTTPHMKIGTIDMPASGPWRPDDVVSAIGWQAAQAHGAALHPIRIDFDYTSGASVSASTVPAGAIVVPRTVIVHTAFDGSAPAVKVGDAGDDDSLIEEADVDLTTIGKYDIDRAKRFAAATALTAAITQGSSAAGAATILMELWS
ncbi:MAG: hypothetical protein H6819_06645 [Phycisphaerales bacterium]|nr:hypothetical protein [Phycisphaerales bacterium]MCB9855259.1 hypothetical protein [Phycisphaerales bacterium]MCB9862852.1 hypothetical protein [Phycisphaerales bacterium]